MSQWNKTYHHHSNPAVSDAKTFYDKLIIRPRLDKAWAILKDQTDGDRDLAIDTIDKYKIVNTKMHAGTTVQEACDKHLLEDVSLADLFWLARNLMCVVQNPLFVLMIMLQLFLLSVIGISLLLV